MANSDLIFRWMQAAKRRELGNLYRELCTLRDFLDGILDSRKAYVLQHLPAIREHLNAMRSTDDVERIKAALDEKLEAMGWQ